MGQFPMGCWNYVAVDGQGPAAVRDWADAGMTLTMSPEFDPGVRSSTPRATRRRTCAPSSTLPPKRISK